MKNDTPKSAGSTNWQALRAKRESAPVPSDDERNDVRKFWADADVSIPAGKTRMTVRFDTDVVEWFKSCGPKYQTRMNSVLRQFMNSQRATTSGATMESELIPKVSESTSVYMDALNQLGKIRLQQSDSKGATACFEEIIDCYRANQNSEDKE